MQSTAIVIHSRMDGGFIVQVFNQGSHLIDSYMEKAVNIRVAGCTDS